MMANVPARIPDGPEKVEYLVERSIKLRMTRRFSSASPAGYPNASRSFTGIVPSYSEVLCSAKYLPQCPRVLFLEFRKIPGGRNVSQAAAIEIGLREEMKRSMAARAISDLWRAFSRLSRICSESSGMIPKLAFIGPKCFGFVSTR